MNGIHAKGSPIKESTRSFFEGRMGKGFSDVRLHRDDDASMAAKEIGAKAFTWKNHIVFNRRYADDDNMANRQLLAHELTHVTQQRSGSEAVQLSPEEGAENTAQEQTATSEAPEKDAEEQEERVMQPESLPDFSTFGQPTTVTVLGKSITVQGRTDATFDNGVGSTKNLKGVPAKNCKGCADSDCFTITGSLVITYGVSTNVTLPSVPDGLTPCQEQRVRDTISGKIAPHESQHVTAFSTYNGTVTLPISYKGCKAGLQAHVQKMHDADAIAREAAAKKKSDALDPFNVPIDLDCEDEAPK
jgi:hypothetical protein